METKFDQPSLWRDYIDAAAAAKSLPAPTADYALRIAREPAIIDVKDAAFLGRLAWVLTRCREPELVSGLLDRALALRPTQPEVKKTLIGGLSTAGRGREALQLYESLPAADRDRTQLVHIHCGMKNWPAAEKECRSLVADKPGDLDAERLLADVLSWKGDHAAALELLAKLKDSLPKDDSIPVRIAEVTLWSGNPEKAMDQFTRLARRRSEARGDLGGIRRRRRRAEAVEQGSACTGAAGSPARSLKSLPSVAPTTMSRLAWTLVRASKNAEAGKLLDLIAAKPPKDAISRREIGGVFAAAGRNADAVKLFEGLELTPEDHLQLASMHAAQKNFDAAIKECQEALAKEPGSKPAMRLSADLLSWMGRHRESLEQFEELRRADPADVELAVRIAEVTLWSGAADRALALFAQELERDFNRPNVQKGFIDAAAAAKASSAERLPLLREAYGNFHQHGRRPVVADVMGARQTRRTEPCREGCRPRPATGAERSRRTLGARRRARLHRQGRRRAANARRNQS